MLQEIYNFVIHPKTKSVFKEIVGETILFQDNSSLPVHNGIPILLSENSIFKIDDIIQNKSTTQDSNFVKTNKYKNYIRKKLLPTLTKDFNVEKRYKLLSSKIKKNSGVILIIGAGDKVDYYKSIFKNFQVIASDVHVQLNADCVIDAHEIPFQDNFFDLVFAAQVIEHTLNPWLLAKEVQRVTKLNGFIQIEAPHNFPYHGQPYDFFRFTYTGMRSLFNYCELNYCEITESNASMVAVTISNYIVNLTPNKYIRQFSILITRILFSWMKYFDNFKLTQRTVSNPKGYAMTFIKDGKNRVGQELFQEFYKLKS